ncbi:hypothetical protein BDA96_06G114500 [Sorghum bicolor]|uniref:Uncharacterized protein n=2 Tax=Sorghum bicolor TaxID=4558 RepID=A0A921QQI6_SORBI|nr:hypothetical protein BDA96_06G114500 [Sorghum bicolor]OQU81696.1 hypothetical protein SORBI_3006G103601 [Sorghum bicolor]
MPARPLHLAAALSLPAGHRWIRGRDLAHVPIRPISGRVLSPAVWENPARAPRGTAGDGTCSSPLSCSAPGLLSLSSSCLVSSRLQLRHHFRKNEELQVAAKVLVERRTERRRCAGDLSCCLLIWRKKKKEASYYLLGITCLVERNQCG